MSIKLRVTFTGLCAFVPNKPLGVPEAPPTKMKVVLVDGGHSEVKAADETILVPHFAAILFKVKNLRPVLPLPPDSEVIWLLNGEEISFKTSANPPIFDVVQGNSRESFKFVADFVKFMPSDFREVHPSYLSANPPAIVSAHVILDKGELKVIDLDTFQEWNIHNPDICADPDKPYKNNLADRVALDFPELPDIRLESVKFEDRQKVRVVDLFPVNGEELVEIKIVNLCDGCLSEPRIPVKADSQNDHDFRWYYELSRSYRTLKEAVQKARKKELPIPEPVDTGGGRPVQCMVAVFKDDAGI